MISLRGVYHNGQIKFDQSVDRDREIPVIVTFLEDEKKEYPKKYSFTDLVGKLEWNGDPVAEQRAIRYEW